MNILTTATNTTMKILILSVLLLNNKVSSSFLIPMPIKNNNNSHLPMLSWFFGNEDEKNNNESNNNNNNIDSNNVLSNGGNGGSGGDRSGGMGNTASMMENFKKNQEIGKRTASILDELSTTRISGLGANGKVKVFVDGQQRPSGIEIEDGYLNNVNGEDLVDSITEAMQDAHFRSLKIMNEKIQVLYSDLGLPS